MRQPNKTNKYLANYYSNQKCIYLLIKFKPKLCLTSAKHCICAQTLTQIGSQQLTESIFNKTLLVYWVIPVLHITWEHRHSHNKHINKNKVKKIYTKRIAKTKTMQSLKLDYLCLTLNTNNYNQIYCELVIISQRTVGSTIKGELISIIIKIKYSRTPFLLTINERFRIF